jgi:hypothetical protein
MTDTFKVLAQTSPSAATPENAYEVPGGTSAVISSIVVANRSATATTFRISVAVGGEADDVKQYLYYDAPIDGNDTVPLTLGISLAETDVVRVYATLATLSFNISGVEVT